MSRQEIHEKVNTDFNLFDNIMKDVETKKREEEEFFTVTTEDVIAENVTTQHYDMMEVDTSITPLHSSQSVQIDTVTSISTPVFQESFPLDSQQGYSDYPESENNYYEHDSPSIQNGFFDDVGSENGGLSPITTEKQLFQNTSNSPHFDKNENGSGSSRNRGVVKSPMKIQHKFEDSDEVNPPIEAEEESIASDSDERQEQIDDLKQFVRDNLPIQSEDSEAQGEILNDYDNDSNRSLVSHDENLPTQDEDEYDDGESLNNNENNSHRSLASNDENSPIQGEDFYNQGKFLNSYQNDSNRSLVSNDEINIHGENHNSCNGNIKNYNEKGNVNESRKSKRGENVNQNERECAKTFNQTGDDKDPNIEIENKNEPERVNFLEEILENIPNENASTEELMFNNKDEETKENEEEGGKKKSKKKVVFERKDTYDELGDRRYDISALELVSEDECEYVNLQEVQQARQDLAEFTMDMGRFNHIITELEKPPEEKERKSTDIFLDELLYDGNSESQEGEGTPNSAKSETKKIDGKSKKSPNRKKKKKENNKEIIFNKVCRVCNNPIIRNGTYPELSEILSDNSRCTVCCTKRNFSSNSSRVKSLSNKNESLKNENKSGAKKTVVRPLLDSRLEKTENAALQKWLKEKKQKEKEKKRQERKEKKAKNKEQIEKMIAEAEKMKVAQKKVEEWEERKRKSSRKNKRSNISASFKTDKSKPIQHSQNGVRTYKKSSLTSRKESPVGMKSEEGYYEAETTNEEITNSSQNDSRQNAKQNRNSGDFQSFESVENFVQFLFSEAVKEIQKEKISKFEQQTPERRPKSVSFVPKAPQLKLYQPSPPKSANPRTRRRLGNSEKQPLYEEDFSNVQHKSRRMKTYDEWMAGKRSQREAQLREQEINNHYDKLQQRLILLEKERQRALLDLRKGSFKNRMYTESQLFESPRLEPQGSEI